MNAFRSSLPRSPHLKSAYASFPFPLPPTVPPGLLAILRNRLYLSISAGAFFFIILLYSYTAPFSTTTSFSAITFPSSGLHRGLWEQLNAIQWRELVLEPVEVPYTIETDQDSPVPWSTEDLLPKGPKGARKQGKGVNEGLKNASPAAPRHRIEVYPRKPVVPRAAPRPDRLMFGIVTTVERAKMMSQLWTRWLIPEEGEDTDENRPACLVLLSKDEEKEDVESLAAILKSRGLSCGLRLSEQVRYEVRVLSMTVEMRDYAADLGCVSFAASRTSAVTRLMSVLFPGAILIGTSSTMSALLVSMVRA